MNQTNYYKRIESKKILVIGDVMLDTYYSGEISRISPEAPVPVFRKKSERSTLGGAANVAANLVAAEQKVHMLSVIGNDQTGDKVKSIFKSQGINTELTIYVERHTTEKTRFLASNNQQILRLDVEDTVSLEKENCKKLISLLSTKISAFDLIIISDYLKGLLTFDFIQAVIRLAKNYNIPVIVDVKDPSFLKYEGATLLKPNLKELQALTGMSVITEDEIIQASEYLRLKCRCDYVLTTCGSRGMVLVGDGDPYFVNAFGQEVYDVTGAGDTAIAYFAACMINGFSMRESVNIANIAAGIQVSKVGTSSVYWPEIKNRLTGHIHSENSKRISRKQIESFRQEHSTKKIVFTNGCFDILHIGHIRYLQEAAKLGDVLFVALNSDASVKRLKGRDRPINSEMERAEMLCALACVDYVAVFDEDTPLELIKMIQPDVLVKGSDYKADEVVGREEVETRGGKLVLLPLVAGKSTTKIIEKIKQ